MTQVESGAPPISSAPTTRAQRTAARIAELPQVRSPLAATGDLLAFAGKAFRDIPAALRLYPEEAVRQAASIVRSNAAVVFAMVSMLGAMIGIMGTSMFGDLGLDSYVGAYPAVLTSRGVLEIMFAWIFAAKAGCGIVAELGAMRITEEVDAIEVMGIRPIPFLISSRLIATIVVMPLMFAAADLLSYFAQKLVFVDFLHASSLGGFQTIFFLFQGPKDLLISVTWTTVLLVIVNVVACYFGYNASGGPVGVGRATAQSMLVNLVATSLISIALAQVFYGGHGGTPVGT